MEFVICNRQWLRSLRREAAAFQQHIDFRPCCPQLLPTGDEIVGPHRIPVAPRVVAKPAEIERLDGAVDLIAQVGARPIGGMQYRGLCDCFRRGTKRVVIAQQESRRPFVAAQPPRRLAEAGGGEVEAREPLEQIEVAHVGIERRDKAFGRVQLALGLLRVLVQRRRASGPAPRALEQIHEPSDTQQRQWEAGGEQRVDHAGR